jgi:hypothetical protein
MYSVNAEKWLISYLATINTQRDTALVLQTKQHALSSSVVLFEIREMRGDVYTRNGVAINFDETQLLADSVKNREQIGVLHSGRRSMKFKRIPEGMNIWVRTASGRENHLFIPDADVHAFMQYVPQAMTQMGGKDEDMDWQS